MTPRVSIEDILGAADWIRAYEAADGPIGEHGACGDERAEELLRVAEWLDAEVARRQDDALARQVMREHNVTRAAARRAISRHRQAERA